MDTASAKPAQPKVLVIDEDSDSVDQLTFHFSREGFRVCCLHGAEATIEGITEEAPSIIVLDIEILELGGLGFCERLRQDPRTRTIPQVVISRRADEPCVVRGLDLGVDAYLRKPFRAKELVARVKAILRRLPRSGGRDGSSAISVQGIEIDPTSFRVKVDGKDVRFTVMEFKVLKLLAKRPGRVHTREEILESVVGSGTYLSRRNIDVHIKAIRNKLGERRYAIETVRGIGYRFRAE